MARACLYPQRRSVQPFTSPHQSLVGNWMVWRIDIRLIMKVSVIRFIILTAEVIINLLPYQRDIFISEIVIASMHLLLLRQLERLSLYALLSKDFNLFLMYHDCTGLAGWLTSLNLQSKTCLENLFEQNECLNSSLTSRLYKFFHWLPLV